MYRYIRFHYKTYSKIETSKDRMKINKNGSSNIFFFLCHWMVMPTSEPPSELTPLPVLGEEKGSGWNPADKKKELI